MQQTAKAYTKCHSAIHNQGLPVVHAMHQHQIRALNIKKRSQQTPREGDNGTIESSLRSGKKFL